MCVAIAQDFLDAVQTSRRVAAWLQHVASSFTGVIEPPWSAEADDSEVQRRLDELDELVNFREVDERYDELRELNEFIVHRRDDVATFIARAAEAVGAPPAVISSHLIFYSLKTVVKRNCVQSSYKYM